MSGSAIAVEIAQADASSPYAAALVRACTEGLRAGGECALATDAGDEPSAAIAVVSWDGPAHLSVRLQVGARSSRRSDWFTSQLRFAPWDAELERWRAAGLVIGTLAAGAVSSQAAEKSLPSPPPRPTASPVERAAPPPEPLRPAHALAPWSFELGAHVARGAADDFGARGASLRAERRIASWFFATASFRYDIQPRASGLADLDWAWLSAGVGAATWLKEVPLVFEARLEPMVGRVQASLSEGGSGASSGVVFGACQGFGGTWWMSDWLGLTLGAELSETTRRTVLRASLDGGPIQPIAVIPQIGWSAGIGVRLGVR